MLCEVPLTKEQQAFATDHHGLVYKFLNENHLPEDEFYDVVVFAYLKAVKDYFNSPSAQKFSFSTIATRQMKFRLYDYFRTQERRKRNMEVLSIHVGLYLRTKGEPIEGIEDFLFRYCEPEPLTEEGFPIYMLKTKAPNGSCIFLTDGRCSVYPARTRTCRIYPLTVGPGERGRDFEYCLCLDRHQSHFTSGRV